MRFVLLLVPVLAVALAYQYVRHEITSGQPGIGLPQAQPMLSAPTDWSKLQQGLGFKLDPKEMQRINGENLARQIQDSTRRMQDSAAYIRNPTGIRWHGMPPH
jgi:hypothetical protein